MVVTPEKLNHLGTYAGLTHQMSAAASSYFALDDSQGLDEVLRNLRDLLEKMGTLAEDLLAPP